MKCPRHGPLHAVVAPNDEDATLARRTLDQLFSELAERTQACPASSQQPIDLEVTWRPEGHVLVRVMMQTRARELSLERDADLGRVPRDGVPLAVAILADEILAEIFDRVASEPPPATASTLAQSAPSPPSIAPALPVRRIRFGLRASYEQLTSGLGLFGPDIEAAWIAMPYLQVGFHAGLRTPAWVGIAPQGSARGFDVGGFVLASTNAFAARGLGALASVDALGLGGVVGTSPAIGVLAWEKLSERFVLSAEARIGGIWGAPTEVSALSGACISLAIGIATEW